MGWKECYIASVTALFTKSYLTLYVNSQRLMAKVIIKTEYAQLIYAIPGVSSGSTLFAYVPADTCISSIGHKRGYLFSKSSQSMYAP